MCNLACGITTTVLGVALVGVATYLGYGFVPNVVEGLIKDEVQLINGTEQMERFEEVPFPLSFKVFIFNITNPENVLAGEKPVMKELGPYVYKIYQYRLIKEMTEDTITYRRKDTLEFDKEASYPYTEDDQVTVANVAFHGVLQRAEQLFPSLMGAMDLALNDIFGNNTNPIMTIRVGSFLLDGVPLCKKPGFVGLIACSQIRSLASNVRNLDEKQDGSFSFSILGYKQNRPSELYVVSRGIEDPLTMGIITTFNNSNFLNYWRDDVVDGEAKPSVCDMVNGTDSGVFPPFVNREQSIYALNNDICRSVELRYQYDSDYEGIPVARYTANEWFLDNNEGCFCLNVTKGINRDDGCLLTGAAELYSCVGAYLVLTYPHFLYADFTYRNGVIGMTPSEDKHRLVVDLEPNTGTIITGAKRAQFNIFFRPITSITSTSNLATTLVPILWVEEGMNLPKDYVDMLTNRLLRPLRLVNILVPVLIAVCALVVLAGVIILIRVRSVKATDVLVTAPVEDTPPT